MPKWILIMDFRLLLSVRSNILHSDLPLCDIMQSKAKGYQERKHKELDSPDHL